MTDSRSVRVFGVSGYSATGKTTLVEALVRSLIRRGHRVATVKSSREDLCIDSHTDTGRHWAAGAEATVLLGPDSTSVSHRRRLELTEALVSIEADFVIVEGMKETEMPKYWCLGKEVDPCSEPPHRGVAAYVTWNVPCSAVAGDGIPIVRTTDIERLTDILESKAAYLEDVSV